MRLSHVRPTRPPLAITSLPPGVELTSGAEGRSPASTPLRISTSGPRQAVACPASPPNAGDHAGTTGVELASGAEGRSAGAQRQVSPHRLSHGGQICHSFPPKPFGTLQSYSDAALTPSSSWSLSDGRRLRAHLPALQDSFVLSSVPRWLSNLSVQQTPSDWASAAAGPVRSGGHPTEQPLMGVHRRS